MGVSMEPTAAWPKARSKLIKAIPRGERERFDTLVLGLLEKADRSPYQQRQAGLLKVGVGTATALARAGVADPELLAVAAVLPWFDGALLGDRSRLLRPY